MSLQHAILGILLGAPSHGYRVVCELEQLVGGGKINTGPVYEALKKLEKRGCVQGFATECAGGIRVRRVFQITARGHREFGRWLKRPLMLPRPIRDDALVKLALIRRHTPGRERDVLAEVRTAQLRRVARARARVEKLPTSSPHEGPRLAAVAFLSREEAELRWVELAIARERETAAAATATATATGREALR